MNNLDKPANSYVPNGPFDHIGLTKRESACIQLGVPESGDPELDELIRKSNRQKAAVAAMQEIISSGIYQEENSKWMSHKAEVESRCNDAVLWADTLFNELEKPESK